MLRNLIDQSAAAFFDQYRFVTPADYCVYNCKNACLEAEDIPCYAIWQRDTPCHNCSSIRALSLKEPVIKLEYLENKVFLILSTPHTVDGRRCVLELAKDVTAVTTRSSPMLSLSSTTFLSVIFTPAFTIKITQSARFRAVSAIKNPLPPP